MVARTLEALRRIAALEASLQRASLGPCADRVDNVSNVLDDLANKNRALEVEAKSLRTNVQTTELLLSNGLSGAPPDLHGVHTVGTTVELCGLRSAHLSGCIGTVVDTDGHSGCVGVDTNGLTPLP